MHKNTTKFRLKLATYHSCKKLIFFPILQYNDQPTFFSIPITLARKNVYEKVDAHTSLSEIKKIYNNQNEWEDNIFTRT